MAQNTPSGALRIGYAERDQTIALLQEHTTAGRLELDEFEDRLAQATVARTRADLEAVLHDLPKLRSTSKSVTTSDDVARPRHHPVRLNRPLPGWMVLSLVMVGIWAMAGFGYFWPMWVIVPSALGALGSCGSGRRGAHRHGDRTISA